MKSIPIKYKGEIYYALIDDEDWDLVNSYHWNISPNKNTFYAMGYKNGIPFRDQKRILMHRLIMGAGPGDPIIDHENRIGIHNYRENLRFITYAGNNRSCIKKNKSGFKGVHETIHGRFFSLIKIDGKNNYLGCFDTAEAAGAAYQIAHDQQIKKELI